MSDRITFRDVDRIALTVGDRMAGTGRTVFAQRRNGYVALDLLDMGGLVLRTLTAGTSREVYTYLQGMRQYQLLLLEQ